MGIQIGQVSRMKAAAAALIRMSSWRGENHFFGFRAGGRFFELKCIMGSSQQVDGLFGVIGREGSFNSPIQVPSNMDSNNVGVAFIF